MSALDTVRSFLSCSQSHDWARLEGLLEPSMTRRGPDGSLISGRDRYLEYLRSVVGEARDYRYVEKRLVEDASGRVVLAELHEELDLSDGTTLRVEEAMVFEVAGERIAALSVYAQQEGE